VLLGEGNDRLTITSTLVAGPDRNSDGTPGAVAVHGGITTVHGGGNSRLASGAIGGDTILISGGGGADSPLVVYGDTSRDAKWYSGNPRVQSIRDFGTKPFPSDLGNGTPSFFFPVASPYAFAGNDVIDGSAHPGAAAGALRNAGIVAYGGAGDDTIIGTQGGDHLAGGSGNDTIRGQRGVDLI
jgi:Ca2+-binding RTX toxin-like protein